MTLSNQHLKAIYQYKYIYNTHIYSSFTISTQNRDVVNILKIVMFLNTI